MTKITAIIFPLVLCGCAAQLSGVGQQPTAALAADGLFISWREHLIDDPRTSGVEFNGSDGLVMRDVDGDGFEDVVSVHESDTTYDGVFWLEQVRSKTARPVFTRARREDSEEMPLPYWRRRNQRAVSWSARSVKSTALMSKSAVSLPSKPAGSFSLGCTNAVRKPAVMEARKSNG